MGCNVSRIDANGAALPARLRPIFVQRLEEIKVRRHAGRPLRDPTPSKKELLSHYKDIDEDNPSHHHHSSNSSKRIPYSPQHIEPGGLKKEALDNNDDMKHKVVMKQGIISPREMGKNDSPIEDVKAKIGDTFTDADEDEDEDDDDDDDERMIGCEDDEAFPGSPSFRVYFEDNEEDCHNDIGQEDHTLKGKVSSGEALPVKESSVEIKVTKRGRKKKTFRMVLPKGGQAAVKNLLKVKSCYSPSSSSHHNAHLLPGKTSPKNI